MPEQHEYAERMFEAPVDLGIAEADRAVCNVRFGTSSYLEGEGGEGTTWYEGGGDAEREGRRRTSSSTRRRAGCRPKATRSSR